jgi:16S rRNA (adenine1518-N6/adenine1519-N6)-dimethyltransferase
VVIRITRKNNIPDVYPIKSPTQSRGAPSAQFNRARFFSLVRAGFSAKRKMLVNNLSSSFNLSKAEVLEVLKKAGLEPTVRAEKLGVEDWVRLYKDFFL